MKGEAEFFIWGMKEFLDFEEFRVLCLVLCFFLALGPFLVADEPRKW